MASKCPQIPKGQLGTLHATVVSPNILCTNEPCVVLRVLLLLSWGSGSGKTLGYLLRSALVGGSLL